MENRYLAFVKNIEPLDIGCKQRWVYRREGKELESCPPIAHSPKQETLHIFAHNPNGSLVEGDEDGP